MYCFLFAVVLIQVLQLPLRLKIHMRLQRNLHLLPRDNIIGELFDLVSSVEWRINKRKYEKKRILGRKEKEDPTPSSSVTVHSFRFYFTGSLREERNHGKNFSSPLVPRKKNHYFYISKYFSYRIVHYPILSSVSISILSIYLFYRNW